MAIQPIPSSCCEKITNFASAVASGLTEAASKVAECVKPHFETLKAFIQAHKQGCLIAGAVVVAGTLLAIFARICCCEETPGEEPPRSTHSFGDGLGNRGLATAQ